MNTERATPEVIDALAGIEMQRQERERSPVSGGHAIGRFGKLYELLPRERKPRGQMRKARCSGGTSKPQLLRSSASGNWRRSRRARQTEERPAVESAKILAGYAKKSS